MTIARTADEALLEPEAFLAAWGKALAPEVRALATEFVAPEALSRRFVLGRNGEAAGLAAALPIAGVIDDFAAGETWRGWPVIAATEAPEDAIVVNCALSQRPHAARARLVAAGVRRALNYGDLMRVAPEIAPPPAFVVDMRRDLNEAEGEWRDLWAAMGDDASRATLGALMRYHLTADPAFTREFSWNVKEQYFDPVAQVRPHGVFVDAGGYDGDTAEAMAERFSDYRRIHIFEPSARNMAAAQARLSGRRDIVFHGEGLAAAAGEALFNPANGSTSALSPSGAERIVLTTIDDAVDEPADFIKMDIEGAEWGALQGARRQIEAHAPTLALAVYHQACDFRRLYRFAADLRGDYRAHLRHYTEGWAETVLYMSVA
ncbi:FkbM family methyltransferase [Plastoroseomonas hellenica]|uniref:FkbM family methyltransferase n=1 Tax=Plastoroseomonas hellenica TaxID=2687306 RepID=UPI001BA79E14|nr:FkbM family methyltransferase [Plastoroseomonas hellenica]MBR0642202.1 FkbM family methyltransferase [Plastoroseomonas hellenica]